MLAPDNHGRHSQHRVNFDHLLDETAERIRPVPSRY